MTTETEETTAPAAPKPKQKPKRRKRRSPPRAAAPKAAKPVKSNEFPGLSPEDCCSLCGEGKCVISGIAHCAHPFKNGLPPDLQGDKETLARFNRAKAALDGHTLKID